MTRLGIEAIKDLETAVVLSVDGNKDYIDIRARSLAGKMYQFTIMATDEGKLSVIENPKRKES